jgi:hypothetical protein
MSDALSDTSSGQPAKVLHKNDTVFVNEMVSDTTKTNSNWIDAESSTYEPPFGARHLDTSDTMTTYSLDSSTDNPNTDYLQVFAAQLIKDLEIGSISRQLLNVPHSHISEALRIFTWKLHEESKDPFQWGISVVLNRNRRYVMFREYV